VKKMSVPKKPASWVDKPAVQPGFSVERAPPKPGLPACAKVASENIARKEREAAQKRAAERAVKEAKASAERQAEKEQKERDARELAVLREVAVARAEEERRKLKAERDKLEAQGKAQRAARVGSPCGNGGSHPLSHGGDSLDSFHPPTDRDGAYKVVTLEFGPWMN